MRAFKAMVLVGVAPVVGLGAALSVGAQEELDPASAISCVTHLQPISIHESVGETIITAMPVERGCYGSLAEGMSAATSGAVQLPSTVTGEELTQEVIDAYTDAEAADADALIGQEAGVVIGIEWDG